VTADPRLETALHAVPGWSTGDGRYAPLNGGITNRNFRVDTHEGTFVLRLAGTDTELLGIDRTAEVEAAHAAAVSGVGPEVVAVLDGGLVTRFVPGAAIPEQDLREEAVLALVVRSLRRIHAVPALRATFDVFRVVEVYRDVAAARGVAIPAAYDDAHAFAAQVEETFARAPVPRVPCHDDLLNANFLRDGDHVWIVDYEYAGMNDPFFDLGNLSINNGLTDEANESLLRLYFGEIDDARRARLALMRVMSDFREAMWGVVQQAISELDVDYVEYADRHFARLLASASDERWIEWLSAV
jgi:thiamine kinase-like enzyme